MYKILSFDGGGIRGLITTVILRRLSKARPGWLDNVDLIAGTSTGGLIALGLAHKIEAQKLFDVYYNQGHHIFYDTWFDDFADLWRVWGADYSNKNLEREVKRLFDDTLLKNLQEKVLITTFDLDNQHPKPTRRTWKPKFFHNFVGNDTDGDIEVYKVALYTSAAPTFFPSVDGYIDGGVVANNPSLAALAQTQDERALIENRPNLGDIALFSIGTGQPLRFISGEEHDWGFAQWATKMVALMLEGSVGVVDYQCRQLLSKRYHRISPLLKQTIDLDDWRKREDLVEIAEEIDLTETVAWLDTYWT